MWYLNEMGELRYSDYPVWADYLYKTGQIYKTEEEAEFAREKLLTTYKYQRYANEHNKLISWNDIDQMKYFACFNPFSNEIEISEDFWRKIQGVIYFTNKEDIIEVIKQIGKERFLKYVLEVEEK